MSGNDGTGIAVLGAGSWGTTIAGLLAGKGHDVTLWAREDEVARSINEDHENALFLPEVRLPENLRAASSLAEALGAAGGGGGGVVVSVVPTQYLRSVMDEARGLIAPGSLVISATKGLENGTLMLPSGIIREVLGPDGFGEIAVVSGPSFAREVARGLPAAVSAASDSAAAADRAQALLTQSYFRVYTNRDVTGVELGGALKNVVAIAAGISDGLELGLNARAALITRGLAEMTRLGVSLGADPMTFSGLSGMGDLVLTCTGALSRNYTVGVELVRGASIDEVTGSMRMVAEGVKTARSTHDLAARGAVEMPIAEAVYQVLYESKPPGDAVMDLMKRSVKGE